MKERESVHKLAFFGPSGSGKSTAAEYLAKEGELLQFLAKHFERHLGVSYLARIAHIIEENKNSAKNLLIINSDVRNNAYEALKQANFIFIRIYTDPNKVTQRLRQRGDASAYNPSKAVEFTSEISQDYIISNNGPIEDLYSQIRSLTTQILL